MKFHKRTRYLYWSNTKLFSWMLPEESKQPFTFEKLKEQLDSGINPTPLIERIIDKLISLVEDEKREIARERAEEKSKKVRYIKYP